MQSDFLEKYDRISRNSLCEVTIVEMNDDQLLRAVLPVAKGGLGVYSARLLDLRFFRLSSRSQSYVFEILGLEHDDETYKDALKLRFDSAICE